MSESVTLGEDFIKIHKSSNNNEITISDYMGEFITLDREETLKLADNMYELAMSMPYQLELEPKSNLDKMEDIIRLPEYSYIYGREELLKLIRLEKTK